MIAQIDSIQTLEVHSLGKIFPPMDEEQYTLFLHDIRQHGVRESGTLLEGKILDGSNRYRAAQELGITMKWVEFDGTDPIAFVISKNLARRHLTTSQAACCAALLQQKLKSKGHIPNPNGYNAWKPSLGRPKRGYANQTSTKVAAIFNIARSTLEKAVALLHKDPSAFKVVLNNPKMRLDAAWKRMQPKKQTSIEQEFINAKSEYVKPDDVENSIPKVFDTWSDIELWDISMRENFDLEMRYVPKTGNGSMGLKHLLIGAAREALKI